MRASLLLVAVLVTGCASTRSPGTLPEPTTLKEVNEVLADERAWVYFADGREPERWRVEVGPESTRLTGERRLVRGPRVNIVPTSEISHIEIDDSLTAGEGAVTGIHYTTGVSLVTIGTGLLVDAVERSNCTEFGTCPPWTTGAGIALLGGTVGLAGIAVGPVVGGATTAKRYPVTVYRAPVTRYPDAALALMEADPAAPLAAPAVPEATAPER